MPKSPIDPEPAFAVRPARAAEHRAARLVLPEAFAAPTEPSLMVAVIDTAPRLVGMAAVVCQPVGSDPPGAPVSVRVIEPFRCRGVGRALVRCAEHAAGGWGMGALCSWEWVPRGGAAARAWEALGFTAVRALSEYELPLDRCVEMLGPLCGRLRERRRVPAGARSAPIAEVPAARIVDLHVAHIGGRRDALERRLGGGGAAPLCPRLSRALLVDGELLGFALCRQIDERTVAVEARVVAPHARCTWANAVLMHDAAVDALERGFRTVRFAAGTAHADTDRLADRVGAPAARILDRYVLRPTETV